MKQWVGPGDIDTVALPRGSGKVRFLCVVKKMAVLSSSVVLLITGWLPTGTGTLTVLTAVGGGAAMIGGCSSDKADTRQDTRTQTRTENRVEDRND